MTNYKKKIDENKGRIKLAVVIALAILMIIRIFFSDKSHIPKIMEPDITWPIVVIQYVLIPLEFLALFLKKKPATILSIINIGVSFIILVEEALFWFLIIFFVMLGANLKFDYLTAEIILNFVFCIAAGTVIVLKEEYINENKQKNSEKQC